MDKWLQELFEYLEREFSEFNLSKEFIKDENFILNSSSYKYSFYLSKNIKSSFT